VSPASNRPPPGFQLQSGRGGFSNHNGPYYSRAVDDGVEQAFFATELHCNGLGLIHGGMLSAFLDGLLAGAASRGGGIPVTIHLSVDFLSMGRAGEWVIGRATLTRAARDVAFAEGFASVRGRSIARATGVFRLMRRSGA
jgi:acyl-coenzyme A thioesterase PaaI-like protein